MAASDQVPMLFKNRLHLAGRPQMSTRRNRGIPSFHLSNHIPDCSIEARDAPGKSVTGIGKRCPTKTVRRVHHDRRRSGQTSPVPSVGPGYKPTPRVAVMDGRWRGHREYGLSFQNGGVLRRSINVVDEPNQLARACEPTTMRVLPRNVHAVGQVRNGSFASV
jgi:hypothetical protein